MALASLVTLTCFATQPRAKRGVDAPPMGSQRPPRTRKSAKRLLAKLPQPWRGEVFVVGSSSIRHELGTEVEIDLRNRGFDVVRHGVSGTGLSRPDRYDWFATSAWLPVSSRTLAVICYIGVNDGQGVHMVGNDWLPGLGRQPGKGDTVLWRDPRWSDEYLRRFVGFVDSFCHRGARDVFVLLPVDVRGQGLDERLDRIRALQVEGVRWSQCGRVLDTRGDMAWIRGPGERVAARRRRDGFHMTTVGAHIVWERVRDQVVAILDRLEGHRAARMPQSDASALPSGAIVPGALEAPHPPPARR